MNLVCVEKNTFGQCGLARIDVGADTNISDLSKSVIIGTSRRRRVLTGFYALPAEAPTRKSAHHCKNVY